MIIRGASGFGDAFYVYPVAKYYSAHTNVIVLSDFPEVFKDLPVKIEKFDRRRPADIDCTYTNRKNESTNVWEDILINAKIKDIPFEHYYKCKQKKTKKVIIRAPYQPTWCRDYDGFMPSNDFFMKIYNFLVNNGYEVLLMNKDYSNTPKGHFNIMNECDLVISQSNHYFVMAEAFERKCCVVFNHKAKDSGNWFVRTITPEKVIIKPHNTISLYDNEYDTFQNKVMEFLK